MNRYTIYCTEEQTRKALQLGAQIETFCISSIEGMSVYNFPTAEQMIGWLDEQGLLVVVSTEYDNYRWEVWEGSIIVDMKETETISSRKEATLAAIDAALEYLGNNNLVK